MIYHRLILSPFSWNYGFCIVVDTKSIVGFIKRVKFLWVTNLMTERVLSRTYLPNLTHQRAFFKKLVLTTIEYQNFYSRKSWRWHSNSLRSWYLVHSYEIFERSGCKEVWLLRGFTSYISFCLWCWSDLR